MSTKVHIFFVHRTIRLYKKNEVAKATSSYYFILTMPISVSPYVPFHHSNGR